MATINPDDEAALIADVRKAVAALARAEKLVDDRRAELSAKVAKAAKGGIKPGVLIHETGKSAETIRQWRNEHGAEKLRPPTAGGFKKANSA